MSKKIEPYKFVIFRGRDTKSMTSFSAQDFGERDDVLYIGDGVRIPDMSELTLSDVQRARIDSNTQVVAIFHGCIIDEEHHVVLRMEGDIEDFGGSFLCELILENLEGRTGNFHFFSCYSGIIREEIHEYIKNKAGVHKGLDFFLHAEDKTINADAIRALVEKEGEYHDTISLYNVLALNSRSTSLSTIHVEDSVDPELYTTRISMSPKLLQKAISQANDGVGLIDTLKGNLEKEKLEQIKKIPTSREVCGSQDTIQTDPRGLLKAICEELGVDKEEGVVDIEALIEGLANAHHESKLSDLDYYSMLHFLTFSAVKERKLCPDSETTEYFKYIAENESSLDFWVKFLLYKGCDLLQAIQGLDSMTDNFCPKITDSNINFLISLSLEDELSYMLQKKDFSLTIRTLDLLINKYEDVAFDNIVEIYKSLSDVQKDELENSATLYDFFFSELEDDTIDSVGEVVPNEVC